VFVGGARVVHAPVLYRYKQNKGCKACCLCYGREGEGDTTCSCLSSRLEAPGQSLKARSHRGSLFAQFERSHAGVRCCRCCLILTCFVRYHHANCGGDLQREHVECKRKTSIRSKCLCMFSIAPLPFSCCQSVQQSSPWLLACVRPHVYQISSIELACFKARLPYSHSQSRAY
jgi:hypothetical protein